MSDLISRQAAINALEREQTYCRAFKEGYAHEDIFKKYNMGLSDGIKALKRLPSVQPEIIYCYDCIYYDPEHIEKDGVRYEYKDVPEEAFDELGTGLVNSEYGINIGGRCCRDYQRGYSEDKRVFVSEMNFCGRAERKAVMEVEHD